MGKAYSMNAKEAERMQEFCEKARRKEAHLGTPRRRHKYNKNGMGVGRGLNSSGIEGQ
jgi:hypothetical protein